MKKTAIRLLLPLVLLALFSGCGANATPALDDRRPDAVEAKSDERQTEPVPEQEDAAPAGASVRVRVTIADAGTLVAAAEEIDAADADSDGVISISDALSCAHDSLYDGGAETGYAAEETEYGLSMTKLWGAENGGSYGYYVNNASAWSLNDPVGEGDHVYAFSYADLEGWSDVYTYFDTLTAEGGEAELTLYCLGFDENWEPVAEPLEGATVTVDGNALRTTTDADGKVSVSLSEPGRHVISAAAADRVIAPPVCIITVK